MYHVLRNSPLFRIFYSSHQIDLTFFEENLIFIYHIQIFISSYCLKLKAFCCHLFPAVDVKFQKFLKKAVNPWDSGNLVFVHSLLSSTYICDLCLIYISKTVVCVKNSIIGNIYF